MAASGARTVVTALGITIGAAAFVATTGIAATLSGQVTSEFDAVQATQVVVRAAEGGTAPPWTDAEDLERVRALPGVADAGVLGPRMTAAVRRPPGGHVREVELRPVDAGALRVIAPSLVLGRMFDAFHVRSQAPVVLLSKAVADRLGVTHVGATVALGEARLTVMGIYDDVERRRETLYQALVPLGSASVPAHDPSEVLIEVRAGQAQHVADNAALALAPEDPSTLRSTSPPDPKAFRRRIEGDVARLSVATSLVALVMGTVSIANAATASLYSRIPEIGLRRALGALPRHVFGQLLVETALLGVAGGALGAALGAAVVFGVAVWNVWAPVLDLGAAGLAVAAGAVAGLVAGLGPAWRATRVHPVDALRR